MASIKFLNVHRTWEDYLGMALGILIVLSPAFAGTGDSTAAMMNAGVVGVLVFALGAFELVDLHRWEESLEMLCGLWLIASPFLLGYSGSAGITAWHIALGALTAFVGGFELWQDRTLSDDDLARHGH